jgi:hypothetical protein
MSCLSVRMEQFDSHWKDFMKFDIWIFFENLSWKFKFRSNLTSITGTLHEDLCAIVSRWVRLRMVNVWDKTCTEIQNLYRNSKLVQKLKTCIEIQKLYRNSKLVQKFKTPILYLIDFFSENHTVYEIMWENTVQPDRPLMAVWHMRISR